MSGTRDVNQAMTPGRREELLAAAREVLATNGYERTTVSSIAGRANVAQGTFYLYFPSKEALPGALARQLSEALAASAGDAVNGTDRLQDAVTALIEACWATAHDFRDVLLVANRGVELAETLEVFRDHTEPFRETLEAFLVRFQETGEIDPGLDRTTTAYVLRDLLDRSMRAKVLFGQDEWARATSDLVRRALASNPELVN